VPEFATVIQALAQSIESWEQIVHLQQHELQTFAAQRAAHGDGVWGDELTARVGTATADELYVARDWQPGNVLLLHGYRTATKIAYGDGIGFFFGAQRFQAPESFGRRVRSRFKALRGARKRKLILPSPTFDRGYFLLPDVFGETPTMPYVRPDPTFLQGVLREAAATLPPGLAVVLPPNRPTALVLLGNFGQAGWTSSNAERTAYLEAIRKTIPSTHHLLIKPHPRTTSEELRVLRHELTRLFPSVSFIDGQRSHYPVEVLLHDGAMQRSDLLTLGFTTACVSLALFFNLRGHVGFGEGLLRRYFPRSWRLMLENEQILERAITSFQPAV